MRYPVEETAQKHGRLLEAAASMFRARGLDGVSVGDVMKAAGMTHGAFYSHFESKDQLIEAAIAYAISQAGTTMTEAIADSSNPKEAFLREYLGIPHRDDPENGCPMAALSVEIGRSQIGRKTLTQHVKNVIRRAVDHFSWKNTAPKRDQAILMTAAMVGAMVLSRAIEDPALSREILNTTRKQILAR